jgi:hypothetical protein
MRWKIATPDLPSAAVTFLCTDIEGSFIMTNGMTSTSAVWRFALKKEGDHPVLYTIHQRWALSKVNSCIRNYPYGKLNVLTKNTAICARVTGLSGQ